MATDWTNPQNIIQYSESGAENVHLSWDDSNGFAGLRSANGTSVGTIGELFHISRSPKPDITNKTYFLKLTGYNFYLLPKLISGIELKIHSKRAGRVTDDVVMLTYNDELLGINQARLEINPIMLYGGETSFWGLDLVTRSMIENSSFGVVVRFQSHPSWPHSDPMDLISVQLRIH